MRKAAAAALLAWAGIGVAACHRPIRPASPPFTITGSIEAIDAGGLQLRHQSGQRMRITLAGGTAVNNDGRPATAADIAAGMRVVIVYHFAEAVAVADEVRLFRGPINYP